MQTFLQEKPPIGRDLALVFNPDLDVFEAGASKFAQNDRVEGLPVASDISANGVSTHEH